MTSNQIRPELLRLNAQKRPCLPRRSFYESPAIFVPPTAPPGAPSREEAHSAPFPSPSHPERQKVSPTRERGTKSPALGTRDFRARIATICPRYVGRNLGQTLVERSAAFERSWPVGKRGSPLKLGGQTTTRIGSRLVIVTFAGKIRSRSGFRRSRGRQP